MKTVKGWTVENIYFRNLSITVNIFKCPNKLSSLYLESVDTFYDDFSYKTKEIFFKRPL